MPSRKQSQAGGAGVAADVLLPITRTHLAERRRLHLGWPRGRPGRCRLIASPRPRTGCDRCRACACGRSTTWVIALEDRTARLRPTRRQAAAPSPRAAGRTRGRRADAAPARSFGKAGDSGARLAPHRRRGQPFQGGRPSQEAPTSHAAEPDQPGSCRLPALPASPSSLSANARTLVTSVRRGAGCPVSASNAANVDRSRAESRPQSKNERSRFTVRRRMTPR